MKRHVTSVIGALVALAATAAGAEILPVPVAVRDMRGAHEDVHALRALDGPAMLGEQRSRALVHDGVLAVEITTRFGSGEHWQEYAEMDLREGYRARSFRKQIRRGGTLVEEQEIDFTTGEVRWLHEGARDTRRLTLRPDTYVGPMLGVVLAEVPERQAGTAFDVVVFHPEPTVYTVRADVIDQEVYRTANFAEPTTKLRLRADLGPVQNVLLASFIPTHYFWFTRESPPEFLAFEGTLGYGGPELRMVPLRVATSTARADAPTRRR
jgi:hypothetical protein